MLTPFYHLSFDYELTGTWSPRTPDGFDMVKDAKGYNPNSMSEPRTPRICLSPSIEGCFYAVYPNIYSLFETKNYPYGEFCLYRAYIDDTDPKFVGNAKIVADRLVWDAHVTKEVWYMDDLEMNRIQKLRITPQREKKIYAHPFNDSSEEKQFISPEVKIEVVKRYPEFYRR